MKNKPLVDYSDSSDENTDEQELPSRKPRKVIPQPSKWKIHVRKQKRNLGQEYISRKNDIIPARAMRCPCSGNCRLQCSTKFTEAERQIIFKKFCAIGDIDKQRYFLAKSIKEVSPKYRYGKGRAKNHAYYFTTKSWPSGVRVCKTFFTATLGISDKMLRTTIAKTGETGELQPDLRGKVGINPKKLDPAMKQQVVEFIQSIPRIESHYLRQQTTREFIDGSKTIMDLYRDYKKRSDDNGTKSVKYSMFRHIFNTDFNISMFHPKKDQCEDCEAYKNRTTEQRTQDERYHQHLKEKNLSRAEKDNDKKKASEELVVAVYDLQAVLPVPRGDISVFYYLSKVSTYNFTVCEIDTMNTYSYLWHEGEASRGANELATCLLKFLREKSKQRTTTEFEVIFYSDNCPGQNKNKYIIGLYNYALREIPNLKSITHKFLIKGHTQNEGDAIHSLIEKQVKKSLLRGPIYVPTQYGQIIRDAKKSPPFINVIELYYKDFYSFQHITNFLGKNFTINTEGYSIHYPDIKVIKLTKNSPDSFQYKISYQDESFRTIQFKNLDRASRHSGDSKTLPALTPAYNKKREISEKKKKELLKLFEKNLMPQAYFNFYNSL